MQKWYYPLALIAIAALAIMAVVILAPSSEAIVNTVEAAGFTDVTVSGPNMLLAQFRCSEGDYYYFSVDSALNTNGVKVTNMYVCAGLLKGHTIRYN